MTLVPIWSVGTSRRLVPTGFILFAVALFLFWREAQLSTLALTVDNQTPPACQVDAGMPPAGNASTCALDIEYLRRRRYNLSDEIVFRRQCIRATTVDDADRSVVTDVPGSLLGGRPQEIDLIHGCEGWRPMPCDEPLELAVPPPFPRRRYPEFLFGVASTFDRLIDPVHTVPQFSHWLGHTGARLLAIVVDAPRHRRDLDRLVDVYAQRGVDLIVAGPTHRHLGVNEHHFTILRNLLQHSTPETKWVSIIDDDTFFPSLYPLADMLSSQDTDEPAYLGGLSDSMDAIQINGLLAFGGAGVFLTLPLVRQLEPKIDQCLDDSNTDQGDALLKNCVYSQTDSRLMVVPGLSQMDLQGDVAGFYESGRFPLSLHHWKSWHEAPVDQMASMVQRCGGCFLQRWRFAGGDQVLTNGYSVASYDGGIGLSDLERTEATFSYSTKFDWSYGPLRPKVDDARKRSLRLVETEAVDGRLRQLYVLRKSARDPDQRDEVLELWWDMDAPSDEI